MAEATPVVTRDPRFLAGRKLIERGLADEAVDIYATLLEETKLQYGDVSIEIAPAYYEYGKSLLFCKDEEASDYILALEMIENSFSIIEEYKDSLHKKGDNKYSGWVMGEFPRVLMGVGDTLSKLNRHADAADAYSRALKLRKTFLQKIQNRKASGDDQFAIEQLKALSNVCEANILIAEELLSCPQNEDVFTTETQSFIVKADERIAYARGYYDQARDALQEVLVFMGSLPRNLNLRREKENVCFLATLVMGLGETMATDDEKTEAFTIVDTNGSTGKPVKKKAKK